MSPLSQQQLDKIEKHKKEVCNYGKDAMIVRQKIDDILRINNSNAKQELQEYVTPSNQKITKIECQHYNYPYSNCVIHALWETRSNLNFHIQSNSMLFSNLLTDHKIISRSNAQTWDIIIYFNENNHPNVEDWDKIYEHIWIVWENKMIKSQFWEWNLWIYHHQIPHIPNNYWSHILFLRKV